MTYEVIHDWWLHFEDEFRVHPKLYRRSKFVKYDTSELQVTLDSHNGLNIGMIFIQIEL